MTKITESTNVKITNMADNSWKEMIDGIRHRGLQLAEKLRAQGHHFKVGILAPRLVGGEENTVPLSGVVLDLDWKIATRLEMIEIARDLITKSYCLGTLDNSLPSILKAVVEGKSLFEQNIGEFFLLYGKFEQKYQLSNGKEAREKMIDLVNGDSRYLKTYVERGGERLDPLPYAVRNILSHIGNNPNTLDQEGKDLIASIKLLKSWVKT